VTGAITVEANDLAELAVGADDALGHRPPGPNLVTGDQLVEAHDLAPPPVAVVGGGLAALIERTATASAAVLACTPAAPAIPGMEAIAWITPALCQQRKFNHMVVTVAR